MQQCFTFEVSKAISCCTKGKCFGHAKNVKQTANSVAVREIESAATLTPSKFLDCFFCCRNCDTPERIFFISLFDGYRFSTKEYTLSANVQCDILDFKMSKLAIINRTQFGEIFCQLCAPNGYLGHHYFLRTLELFTFSSCSEEVLNLHTVRAYQ